MIEHPPLTPLPHQDVVDLRDQPHVDRVAVHIDRNDNPFAQMSQEERMRLFIRVLCELVAYGEPEDRTPVKVRPVPVHRRARTASPNAASNTART